MTVKQSSGLKAKEVVLSVFFGYDLTGGGLPFGHIRVFHVELKLDGKTIVRNRYEGEDLKEFVEKSGKPAGKKEKLPYGNDFDWSRSYRQKYLLPASFTPKQIEKEVPAE